MESIPISGVNGECIRVDISLVFAEGKVRLGHLHILDLVLVSETEVPRVTRDALCNLEGFFFFARYLENGRKKLFGGSVHVEEIFKAPSNLFFLPVLK